jgi:hypothetical protein
MRSAQALVAAGSTSVVAVDVVQVPNDKQQLAPMLDKISALPNELSQPETRPADSGYFSEANVEPPIPKGGRRTIRRSASVLQKPHPLRRIQRRSRPCASAENIRRQNSLRGEVQQIVGRAS